MTKREKALAGAALVAAGLGVGSGLILKKAGIVYMKMLLCAVIAYLIGSLSPAALISKLKHEDLSKGEKGNLGATNTTLAFGKTFGLLVMLLDVFKGFLAVKIATWVVPETEWVAMLAGFLAVLGHCFPFYLKFKGGKGLATFGGAVLAYNPLFFLFALITGVIVVLITNSGTAITYYAALIFPIFVAFKSESIPTTVICIAMSLFMMAMFIPNLIKAIKGEEHKSRDFLKKNTPKSETTENK